MKNLSFKDTAIVSCGTLRMELNRLQTEGFLDTDHLFFTTPGLHEDIHELERQLVERINKAKEVADQVIVVYGGKFCYVNADEPLRKMDTIIEEQGPKVVRINATHCMDMIASEPEREKIALEMAGGEKVWWMTPGWVRFRKLVFKGWDKAWPMKIFPGMRAAPLCWTASDILMSIWRNIRKNFWITATGWAFPCRPVPPPWTGSNPCCRSSLKNCKIFNGAPAEVAERGITDKTERG